MSKINFSFKQQVLLVLGVAMLPFISLLLRGQVWGADSFAFLSVACGNVQHVDKLGHLFFAQFVPLFGCNLLFIFFIMFLFYFLALLGIWVFAKTIFVGEWFSKWDDKAFLLPVCVGTITPLFFVEGLRFENDFFGWTLSFMGLGLISILYKRLKDKNKGLV